MTMSSFLKTTGEGRGKLLALLLLCCTKCMLHAPITLAQLLSQRCTVPHHDASRSVRTIPWKVHPVTAQNSVLDELPLPWSGVIEKTFNLLNGRISSFCRFCVAIIIWALAFLQLGFLLCCGIRSRGCCRCFRWRSHTGHLLGKSLGLAGDKPLMLI